MSTVTCDLATVHLLWKLHNHVFFQHSLYVYPYIKSLNEHCSKWKTEYYIIQPLRIWTIAFRETGIIFTNAVSTQHNLTSKEFHSLAFEAMFGTRTFDHGWSSKASGEWVVVIIPPRWSGKESLMGDRCERLIHILSPWQCRLPTAICSGQSIFIFIVHYITHHRSGEITWKQIRL